MKAARLMITITDPENEKQLKFVENLKNYLEKNKLGFIYATINNNEKSITLDLRLLDNNKSFVKGYIKRHYSQNKNIELSNFFPVSQENVNKILTQYNNPSEEE